MRPLPEALRPGHPSNRSARARSEPPRRLSAKLFEHFGDSPSHNQSGRSQRLRYFPDARGKVIHFLHLFKPYIQYVHTTKPEDVLHRLIAFVVVVAQSSFANNLHSNNTLA